MISQVHRRTAFPRRLFCTLPHNVISTDGRRLSCRANVRFAQERTVTMERAQAFRNQLVNRRRNPNPRLSTVIRNKKTLRHIKKNTPRDEGEQTIESCLPYPLISDRGTIGVINPSPNKRPSDRNRNGQLATNAHTLRLLRFASSRKTTTTTTSLNLERLPSTPSSRNRPAPRARTGRT